METLANSTIFNLWPATLCTLMVTMSTIFIFWRLRCVIDDKPEKRHWHWNAMCAILLSCTFFTVLHFLIQQNLQAPDPVNPELRKVEFKIFTVTLDKIPLQLDFSCNIYIDPNTPNAEWLKHEEEIKKALRNCTERYINEHLYVRFKANIDNDSALDLMSMLSTETDGGLNDEIGSDSKNGYISRTNKVARFKADEDKYNFFPQELRTAFMNAKVEWTGQIKMTHAIISFK